MRYISFLFFIFLFPPTTDASDKILDILIPKDEGYTKKDEFSCFWLKGEYKNCIQSSGWQNGDFFGHIENGQQMPVDAQAVRDAVSICNSLSVYLKEVGCYK